MLLVAASVSMKESSSPSQTSPQGYSIFKDTSRGDLNLSVMQEYGVLYISKCGKSEWDKVVLSVQLNWIKKWHVGGSHN